MRWDPVEYDTNTSFMQRIDQGRKVIRRPVPARRRVKPGHLITPRRIVRVLGHRQKLDMRKAYVLHISDQFVGQFAVRVRLGVDVFAQ